MGRNQKENLDYFCHENGMRNDKKLKAVRGRFGHLGYAIYNMLLENISESNLLVVEDDEINMELLAGDFDIDSEKLIEIINYFVRIDLVQKTNGYIYCRQLEDRQGIGDEGQADTLSHHIGDRLSADERHVAEGRKHRQARENRIGAVHDARDHRISGHVGLLRQIARVGDHDPESEGQGEEDLAEGIDPDRGLGELRKIGFQVRLEPGRRALKGEGPDDERCRQDEEQGEPCGICCEGKPAGRVFYEFYDSHVDDCPVLVPLEAGERRRVQEVEAQQQDDHACKNGVDGK